MIAMRFDASQCRHQRLRRGNRGSVDQYLLDRGVEARTQLVERRVAQEHRGSAQEQDNHQEPGRRPEEDRSPPLRSQWPSPCLDHPDSECDEPKDRRQGDQKWRRARQQAVEEVGEIDHSIWLSAKLPTVRITRSAESAPAPEIIQ